MKLHLKNYTTSVNAERTIMEVEQLLAMFGATAVMKQYSGDQRVTGLAFKLGEMTYKLPVNQDGVYQVMFKDLKRISHRVNAGHNREEQAYRVAWRILKDWIHSQMSIIASGQATPEQVLLPYAYDGKRTLYEAYKEGRLQLKKELEHKDDFIKPK